MTTTMVEKQKNIFSIFRSSLQQTFADMAFLDAEPSEAAAEIDYSSVLYLDITSPVKGNIILFLPLELKKKIAENIYSQDFEELKPKLIDDCLLEMLNVLAGKFLSSYYHGKSAYTFTFPELLFSDEYIGWDIPASKQLYFNADDRAFKAVISLDAH